MAEVSRSKQQKTVGCGRCCVHVAKSVAKARLVVMHVLDRFVSTGSRQSDERKVPERARIAKETWASDGHNGRI